MGSVVKLSTWEEVFSIYDNEEDVIWDDFDHKTCGLITVGVKRIVRKGYVQQMDIIECSNRTRIFSNDWKIEVRFLRQF